MSIDTPLLSLATVLFAGIIGGELLGRLHLPKVTGWIGTGILLRALELPGLEVASLGRFSPFTNFVLGYIAFTVGAALHFMSLKMPASGWRSCCSVRRSSLRRWCSWRSSSWAAWT